MLSQMFYSSGVHAGPGCAIKERLARGVFRAGRFSACHAADSGDSGDEMEAAKRISAAAASISLLISAPRRSIKPER